MTWFFVERLFPWLWIELPGQGPSAAPQEISKNPAAQIPNDTRGDKSNSHSKPESFESSEWCLLFSKIAGLALQDHDHDVGIKIKTILLKMFLSCASLLTSIVLTNSPLPTVGYESCLDTPQRYLYMKKLFKTKRAPWRWRYWGAIYSNGVTYSNTWQHCLHMCRSYEVNHLVWLSAKSESASSKELLLSEGN